MTSSLRMQFVWVAVISLVLAIIAVGVARQVGTTYQADFSYLISVKTADNAPATYHYDGYYAIQAAGLFSQTFATWLASPETQAALYQTAALTPTTSDRIFGSAITATSAAPQLVQVTIHYPTDVGVRRLAAALGTQATNYADMYNTAQAPALQFGVTATTPVVGPIRVNTRLIGVGTFIAALLLGVNIVLLWMAAHEDRH